MEKLKILQKELKHIEYVNRGAPFPIFDTEYVGMVKDEINKEHVKINTMTKEEYDELPVVACKGCKRLYIEVDDDDNDICMRCGSINEIKEYKNIHEYREVNKDILKLD
jgi:hypothetical protein|tara:strand:+ start:281 stop:607 length:327 start_codon:yes stop_codon:yes gene_type:complete